MTMTIGEMSREEFKQLIEETIESKLFELLNDPDKGLALREEVEERLLNQQKAVANSERGQDWADLVRKLGLEG